MSLKHYRVSPVPHPVFFYTSLAESDMDMNQPYQRGIVWGLKRRQNFIRSLLSGVPVPAVVLNDRYGAQFAADGYEPERTTAYAVVDGKQRITTLRLFVTDAFGVPPQWWEDDQIAQVADDGLVYWSGLTRVGRSYLNMNCHLPSVEGRFASLDEEKELFDLINFGGLAQGEVDTDLDLDAAQPRG